ncbi:unnamed protein product [Toxocara canis]|uniref:Pepsin-I3 domain-containing protein n=1 Tax=Toxocara canis TaxID=6265 RepID=A0A183TZ62_TOXCA|nr:unnamed protein product [Toxocara canis]
MAALDVKQKMQHNPWNQQNQASAITIVLAHPLSSERNVQVYEVDDEKFGCRVEDGKKLFFDEIFIRELTEKEQEENAKYEELLKEHVEGFDKAAEVAPTDENGLLDLSNADFPSVPEEPSFCTALVKVELDGCFALDGKLYKDSELQRELTKEEKEKVKEYEELVQRSFDDYYEKLLAGESDPYVRPAPPKLCN